MTYQDLDLTIRPGVILGPAIARDGVSVHMVYNVEENSFYIVGDREFFIIDRLNRGLDLDSISQAYADVFGKALGVQSWRQMAVLLGSKRLLLADGFEFDVESRKKRLIRKWGLSSGRFGLFDPGLLIVGIQRHFPWMISKWALIFGVLSCTIQCIVVGCHFRSMKDAVGHVFSDVPTIAALSVVILFVSMFAHEMGHALACVGVGVGCGEIGLAWRLPMLYFYASTDEVYLVAAHRRVIVSAAGILAGSVPLLPFAVAYPFLGKGVAAELVAAILLPGFFATVVNLLPFFGLDGQRIVSHSLGVWNISSEGRSWILNAVFRKDTRRCFSSSVKIFAIFELLATALLVVASTWWWIEYLTAVVGAGWATIIVNLCWFICGLVLIHFVFSNRKAY